MVALESVVKCLSAAGLASLAICVFSVVRYVRDVAKVRVVVRKLQRQGKPFAPHNIIFGSLLSAKDIFGRAPPAASYSYMLSKHAESFEGGAFYFDSYPFMTPMLVVADPVMANQLVYHPVAGSRKPASLRDFLLPITGGSNMFDGNGPFWKQLHDTFAPVFKPANTTAMVPLMVRSAEKFILRLDEKVTTGERFALVPLVLDAITDIIGPALLNAHLDTQSQPHPLAEAMRAQIELQNTHYRAENVFANVNPWLRFKTWSMSRRLNRLIQDEIDARFAVVQARSQNQQREAGKCDSVDQLDESHNSKHMDGRYDEGGDSSRGNATHLSVLDAALEDYLAQPQNAGRTSLDPDFTALLRRNLRMFFFAGHSASGAAACICLQNIYKRPEVLARVREEHDAVLGPADQVAAAILADPWVLGRLPYTTACLRESMRLSPQANGIRDGAPGVVLEDRFGVKYPTEGFAVQTIHMAIARNKHYWARPHEFLPERWLVEPGHELYPPKGGWRVFELGPRACPGQEIVMKDVKTLLAFVVRRYDLRVCYDEIDAETGTQHDLSLVYEERAYLVDNGSAHPVDGLPCRVSRSRGTAGQASEGT